MNIRMKKLLALLLALIMTVGLFPTASFAEEAGTSGAAKPEKVFTEEDNAILDQDVFARIDDVKAEAAQKLGFEDVQIGSFSPKPTINDVLNNAARLGIPITKE